MRIVSTTLPIWLLPREIPFRYYAISSLRPTSVRKTGFLVFDTRSSRTIGTEPVSQSPSCLVQAHAVVLLTPPSRITHLSTYCQATAQEKRTARCGPRTRPIPTGTSESLSEGNQSRKCGRCKNVGYRSNGHLDAIWRRSRARFEAKKNLWVFESSQ
jgi:hypothetical protein